MEYEAVIFDNDGVLTHFPPQDALEDAIRRAYAEFNVEDPPGDHISWLGNHSYANLSKAAATYGIDPEELWMAKEEHDREAQIDAVLTGRKPLYDDVPVALKHIDARLGLASNNQQETVEFIVDHFGYRDRFEVVLGRPETVEAIALQKPNPHFIERAVEELGVNSALYVGDRPKDVVAAELAGIDAAFVRRPHSAEQRPPVTPAFDIENLEELAEKLS